MLLPPRLTPYEAECDTNRDKVATPLATVPIGKHRQLRMWTVRSATASAVELRTYLRDGRRGFRPVGNPLFVFAAQLPAVLAALTEAAAALDLPASENLHADA